MIFRLLIDPPLDGATNMARDEALLTLHERGLSPPTLRLYRWSPACLSLGRFQRSAEIDRGRCEALGVDVVRRPSGGRALLHDCELTYAVVARADSALGGGAILESYRRISTGLLVGLARLGVDAMLAPFDDRRRSRDERPTRVHVGQPRASDGSAEPSSLVLSPSSSISAACYDAPARYELTVAGRKLVGSAQRRYGGTLLQHGAIPFVPHTERLCAVLRRPPADMAQRMITLAEALGRDIGFEEVADALVGGCVEAWDTSFEPGPWTDSELALAEELRRAYMAEDWTWGR